MDTLSPDMSKMRLPAGAELMHQTPKIVRNLGGLACVASTENGSADADGTETTASMDPGTMDPYTLFDGVDERTSEVAAS